MAELWEKQEYETPKQYEYFCAYRDMGLDRSLKKLQAQYGKPISFLKACEKYSVNNHWQVRCNAYQEYLDKIQREENEREIIEMNKRHIQQSLMLQKKIIDKMKDASPKELKLGDCARILETTVRIERMARGCDSGRIMVEQSGTVSVKQDNSERIRNLSDEDLQTINSLLEKAEQ